MALNVTSLFSRIKLSCALTFSVALLTETALTSKGQQILTQALHSSGRCVVWGAPGPGKGVTASKGGGIIGGPRVQLSQVEVPDFLRLEWKEGRFVAGRVTLRSSKRELSAATRSIDQPAVLSREGHDSYPARLLHQRTRCSSAATVMSMIGWLESNVWRS